MWMGSSCEMAGRVATDEVFNMADAIHILDGDGDNDNCPLLFFPIEIARRRQAEKAARDQSRAEANAFAARATRLLDALKHGRPTTSERARIQAALNAEVNAFRISRGLKPICPVSSSDGK